MLCISSRGRSLAARGSVSIADPGVQLAYNVEKGKPLTDTVERGVVNVYRGAADQGTGTSCAGSRAARRAA